MKAPYRFYVTDWAPNGTNDLAVYRAGKQVAYFEAALFGVNVSKLRPGPEGMYRINIKLLKKSVASGPFGEGFEDNCKRLSKYLGGAK